MSLITNATDCTPCAAARLRSDRAGGDADAPRREGPRADNVASVLSDDSVKALAGLTTTTEECAEGIDHVQGTPCATKKALKVIMEFVVATGASDVDPAAPAPREKSTRARTRPKNAASTLPSASTPESEAVRAAAAVLGCDSESCVIAHPSLREFVVERQLVAPRELELELAQRFKASGPRDSLALLSNYNIDETLQRWARVFTEFFPCPFAMMDFDHNGDLFGTVDIPAILEGRVAADLGPGAGRARRPFSCFGCVVNTDTSAGPGKHWVAVFVDCRGPQSSPWTVEYFNSAGRPPPKPMLRWMERTRARLAEHRAGQAGAGQVGAGQAGAGQAGAGDVVSVPVTDMDHQESQTECGLYALFYIRRRLEGTPYRFFEEQLVPDDAMTAFRRHVFRAQR